MRVDVGSMRDGCYQQCSFKNAGTLEEAVILNGFKSPLFCYSRRLNFAHIAEGVCLKTESERLDKAEKTRQTINDA